MKNATKIVALSFWMTVKTTGEANCVLCCVLSFYLELSCLGLGLVRDLALSCLVSQSSNSRDAVCVFPPLLVDGQHHEDTITIFKSDMDKLVEGQQLNDSLVEFYHKYLQLNAR
jgi:hypothetical protein